MSRALQQFRFPKEVVPPRKFDPKSGTSLRKFLSNYERYFDSKYDGTDRDKSLQLGLYLVGSAKSAYNAMNGSSMRYPKLKLRLLDWYNSECTSVRQKKLDEFQVAQINPGESYSIYAMRLEELAIKAFPDSRTDRDRQLRRKFQNSVPQSFLNKLESAQSTLALFGDRKLSWNQIKKLASSVDRELREKGETTLDSMQNSAKVWYAQPVNAGRNITESSETKVVYSRDFNRSPNKVFQSNHKNTNTTVGANFSVKRNRTPFKCNFCARQGHMQDRCWRKLGLCTVCGSKEHNRNKCPKLANFCHCQICKSKEHAASACPINKSERMSLLNS